MNVDQIDFEAALNAASKKAKLKGLFSDKELISAEEQLIKKIERLNKQLEAVVALQIINEKS
jgi:hypothetical protein